MPRPLNYTTKIPAKQTAGECLDLLAESGADHVAVAYENRQPAGLSFRINTPNGWRDFHLPVNAAAMHKRLVRARRDGDFASLHASVARMNTLTGEDNARNVAWRVVKDWLEAQLALIAAEMASIDEVFLPYLLLPSGPYAGRTLYAAFREDEARALPAGGTGGD